METLNNPEIDDSDIILDLDEHSGMNINFGASLFTKNHPSFDLTKLNSDIRFTEKSIERDDLVLRIHVIISAN